MTSPTVLVSVQRGTNGAVTLSQSTANAALPSSFSLVAGFEKGGRHVAAFYAPDGGTALFSVTAKALAPIGKMKLPAKLDKLESFVIGDRPHLLGYEEGPGTLHFIPVNDDLSAGLDYTLRRTHEPGPTAGFTTIKPFVTGQAGTVIVLGYNAASGKAAMYTVSVRATAPPNTPPLFALVVWSHQWAANWQRFAFFDFGQTAFFLKTNVNAKAPNVNIDHVLDNPSDGTVEVASFLQDKLPDNQTLALVEPVVLGHGEPHFATYKADGLLRLYRIWGDCSGWDELGKLTVAAKFKALRVFSEGEDALMLLA